MANYADPNQDTAVQLTPGGNTLAVGNGGTVGFDTGSTLDLTNATIVGGSAGTPAANTITSAMLQAGAVTSAKLAAGAALANLGLPTADPGVSGQIWNNAGVLTVSAGS